jgi:hypothetical protein
MSALDAKDFRRRVGSIEWRDLSRGVGGEDVGALLLALLTDRAPALERRMNRLEQSLAPFGALAPVALPALPFLVELVHHRVGDGALYDLVRLIATCATPDSEDEGHAPPAALALADACQKELAVGIPDYLRDIGDTSWPVQRRAGALAVLACLSAWRDQWLAPLRALHEREQDPQMKAEIVAWFPDLFR